MKTTIPTTFREIRPDLFEIERAGKRLGAITQNHINALRDAGRWTVWIDGHAPQGTFATVEEAKETAADFG